MKNVNLFAEIEIEIEKQTLINLKIVLVLMFDGGGINIYYLYVARVELGHLTCPTCIVLNAIQ
jgi:hypothetical protein